MQHIQIKDLRFFVPAGEKARILNEYGELTFADFDKEGLNDAIGALYPGAKLDTAYMSIGAWSRQDDPRVLHGALGSRWSDMFNVIHSVIRSGEEIWYPA